MVDGKKYLFNNNRFLERRKELRKNQTDAEKLLWSKLRNNQLGVKFFRQYSIGPYILDFYAPKVKLAIELDGSQHLESEVKLYDKEREGYLSQFHIQVIRFWNNDVFKNMEGVLAKITERI